MSRQIGLSQYLGSLIVFDWYFIVDTILSLSHQLVLKPRYGSKLIGSRWQVPQYFILYSREQSCIPIRYFRSVFGRYFSVFTIPIPQENSVGTFRYQKGGSAPLFRQKGGNGPLFEKLHPLLEKRGEERGKYLFVGQGHYALIASTIKILISPPQ